MSTYQETKPVVVGVDGSESALRAATWAAGRAARRGVGLRLVYAFELPVRPSTDGVTDPSVRELLLQQGTSWLASTRAAAEEAAPGVSVETVGVDASAAALLIDESESASLVVLGSRGLGALTGLLIESTATAVAAHGHCPMVVLRGEVRADGPVVVGVDGTATSDSAVAFAFAEAELRGTGLVAVHSVENGSPDEACRTVADRLTGWEQTYPDVHVARVVVHDKPTPTLLAHAATAQLVVVGTRGRGGLRGLVLGSTSQALLHHSPCPVAVVRTGCA